MVVLLSASCCNRTCQRNHWKVHKKICGKPGASGSAGGGAGNAIGSGSGTSNSGGGGGGQLRVKHSTMAPYTATVPLSSLIAGAAAGLGTSSREAPAIDPRIRGSEEQAKAAQRRHPEKTFVVKVQVRIKRVCDARLGWLGVWVGQR